MYFTLVCVILAIFLASVLLLRVKFTMNFSWIPGPFAWPILGNSLSLLGSQVDFFKLLMDCGKKYGTPFRLWVGLKPFVFIGRAEDVQPILSSYQNLDKNCEYTFLHEWLGTGLITGSGHKWYARRKLLTPSFHSNILVQFIKPIKKQCDVLTEKLLKHAGKEAFNIVPYSKLCSLDIICVIAMGKEINAQKNGSQEYVDAIYGINASLQKRFTTPWLKPDFIFKRSEIGKKQKQYLKVIHEFVAQVIAARKLEMSHPMEIQETRKHIALLDLLLAEHKLSDDDVVDEVNTFMFGGHDTTSVAISWALYVFGKHVDVQELIIKEYEETVEEKLPTYWEIKKLKYLERCIMEVMRMYPVVPLIARDIKNTVELDGGILIPGTTALINTVILHRDPRYFEHPDIFNPDRFLPDESERRYPFCFIPFSAGPRNCIGSKLALMEIKMVLIHILKQFIVKSVDKEEDLRLFSEIVLSNKNGVRLKLEERNM